MQSLSTEEKMKIPICSYGLLIPCFFIGASLYAQEPTGFKQCPKTYVDPDHVDLIENTISVETQGVHYRTSAIYSDDSGLYYKDFYHTPPQADPIPLMVENYLISDARGTDFFDKSVTETSPMYSDEPQVIIPDTFEDNVIEPPKPERISDQEVTHPSPALIQDQAAPADPTKSRGIWPFCNKKDY